MRIRGARIATRGAAGWLEEKMDGRCGDTGDGAVVQGAPRRGRVAVSRDGSRVGRLKRAFIAIAEVGVVAVGCELIKSRGDTRIGVAGAATGTP